MNKIMSFLTCNWKDYGLEKKNHQGNQYKQSPDLKTEPLDN